MSKFIFDHVAICVENIDDTAIWYSKNVDATIDYIDKSWAMLDIKGTKLALTLHDHHPPHVAFCVDSLEELGPDYREHRDGSCYVYKMDPSGNIIELIYWRNEINDTKAT